MDASQTRFTETRRRPRWWVIALVVLGHLLAFYGLVRAFAPGAIATVERSVLATFNVTITAPPPPPEADARPDEGAAGAPGKQAVPKPVTAPKPRVPISSPSPVPRASSTGSQNSSGARQSGEGTGASGSGEGTGSGRDGGGQGGVGATRLALVAGRIDSATDFPIPPGGRQARFGTSVLVYIGVDADGRPTGCRIVRPSPDPTADGIVCRLALQRFRFRPKTDGGGRAIPGTFGYTQSWFPE